MDQELAITLGPEDRRGDHRPGAETVFAGRRDDSLETLFMYRGVADDALVGPAFAGLELGLHERDDLTAGGERGHDRAEDLGQRDEGDVDRDERDRLREGGCAEIAGIRLLHRHDPWVLP